MNNSYGIPGVVANFEDYQLSKAVPVGPGKVNVILGDLPDTYKVADGSVDGYKEIPFPANQPMLINNGKTASKSITGANIIGGDTKNMDMANVMRMLDLTRPTAFCKIVKRDGSRPNMLSLHEKYQALEHAYEELANYPVSRAVVLGTAFDDSFAELPNVETYSLSGQEPPTLDFVRKFITEAKFGYKLSAEGKMIAVDPFTISATFAPGSVSFTVGGVNTNVSLDVDNKVVDGTGIRTPFDGFKMFVEKGTLISVNIPTITVTPVFYNTKEIEIIKAKVSGDRIVNVAGNEVFVKVTEGASNFTPAASGTLVIETVSVNSPDGPKGKVVVNGDVATVTIDGAEFTQFTLLPNWTNEKEITFAVNGLKITIVPGSDFTTEDTIYNRGVVINYVPLGSDVVTRTAEFCNSMTINLTECKATFGVRPPKNTSSKEIRRQYNRLVTLEKANKGFVKIIDAENMRDLGMFIDVVVGAVKVGDLGGITNFPEVEILEVKGKILKTSKNQLFKEGDSVNVYAFYRQDIYNEENIVASVDNNSSEEYTTIVLSKPIESSVILNSGAITIENTANKDDKGTYLAALYTNITANFGVEASYIKATVPGIAETAYTRDQLINLVAKGYTVINKDATSDAPVIIDTPTMARDDSDFTDQSTRDLLFYFLEKLRDVAKPYKGERFGAAAKRSVFESSLKSVFENQVGVTINSFTLDVDYDYLQTSQQLFVSFGINEARTGKQIAIDGRLY